MCKGLWDGAYGLLSLCEKTRKSNRLQIDVITKAALSPQLFKDPVCWSGWGLKLRPPAQQTGAYPIELTGRVTGSQRQWETYNAILGKKIIEKYSVESTIYFELFLIR